VNVYNFSLFSTCLKCSLVIFVFLEIRLFSGRKDCKYGIATVQYTLSSPNFHSYHLFPLRVEIMEAMTPFYNYISMS